MRLRILGRMRSGAHHFAPAALLVAAIGLGAASPAPAVPSTPAPGWLEALRWVNTAPLTAARLRGRAVLVEFWTFDCINCRRTVPAMRRLAGEFAGDSTLVIIGVHTPELPEERDPAQVRAAVARLDLRFPVGRDDDFIAWRAFGNEYWPCLYLLDGGGRVRWVHVGELHEGTAAWRDLHGAIARLTERRR